MAMPPCTLSIADLIGSAIVTAEGERLGHVVDLEVDARAEYRVSALVFGRYGWLYRFHALASVARRLGRSGAPRRVPWAAVDRFERFTVTLKPGCELETEESLHA
jgi:sporulation protein YlmC with PRC-barrel domain